MFDPSFIRLDCSIAVSYHSKTPLSNAIFHSVFCIFFVFHVFVFAVLLPFKCIQYSTVGQSKDKVSHGNSHFTHTYTLIPCCGFCLSPVSSVSPVCVCCLCMCVGSKRCCHTSLDPPLGSGGVYVLALMHVCVCDLISMSVRVV